MKQGWEIKKLKEVCAKITDGTHQTPKYFDEGYIFLSSKNVTTGKIDWENVKYIDEKQHIEMYKRVAPKVGDILLAKNGTTGVAAMVDRDVVFDIYVSLAHLSPLKNISPYYLLHFINSPLAKNQFNKRLKGAGVPNLHLEEIREVEIPLPPFPEQQRIVSILDRAFAAIAKAKANAEQNLKNAKELFENAAQAIFTKKGIDWEEKLLGEFATFRNGINYTKGSKREKIKIVGVKDFQDSYWVPNKDLVEVSLDGKINETDLLKEGDILAVRSNGNPQLIGRTLLAGKINEKVSHSGFTIRIRLNSKIVNPNYLCHFLKIQQTRKTLVESGNGVGIRSLNQGSLSSLKIPFPKSLKEQEVIIDKVDSIAEQSQKLKEIYQRKLNDLEELKKSILQKAFAGELHGGEPVEPKTEKVVAI